MAGLIIEQFEEEKYELLKKIDELKLMLEEEKQANKKMQEQAMNMSFRKRADHEHLNSGGNISVSPDKEGR